MVSIFLHNSLKALLDSTIRCFYALMKDFQGLFLEKWTVEEFICAKFINCKVFMDFFKTVILLVWLICGGQN